MVQNRTPEYFLTVARLGSITRAAEELHITQPSISQHIAKLEESLGARLLDRTQTPLALTPSGELYRDYLESSDFLYQKFQSDLNDINTISSRTVHLGLGSWRGSILFPQILPRFLLERPEAQVYLHEFPVSEMAKLIKNGNVDFSVMNTTTGDLTDEIITETIDYERILLVMNRNDPIAMQFRHARQSGQPYDLQALTRERFISLSDTLCVGRQVGNFLEQNRLVFAKQIRTTNNSTVLKLVTAGMGFCFLVETGLEDAARYAELEVFDLKTPDLTLPLSLCYRKSSYLSPLAHDLIAVIEAYYKDVLEKNRSKAL